jgi:hypothetical protein
MVIVQYNLYSPFFSSEALPTDRSGSFFNSDFTVDLRRAVGGAVKACEVGYFTILDEGAGEQVTMIEIPQSIFVSGSSLKPRPWAKSWD